MDSYKYQDKVFTFEGSISVNANDTYCMPWIIDYEYIDLYPFVSEQAKIASGVRLTFTTDSENIGLKLFEVYDGMRFDFFSNGKLIHKYEHEGIDNKIILKKFEKGTKSIEIWLDPRFPFMLESILVEKKSTIQSTLEKKKRWIHYGSSISQSGRADSPSAIWPGIVARRSGLHLTNLGYGGECLIEPMIALMIRDSKADFISLKLGVNYYGISSRIFKPAVIGMIRIIREKHKCIPLFILSPIYSPDRDNTKISDGSLSLIEMRSVLKETVDIFKKYGDDNICYVDGLDILGPGALEYLPDRLHPDGNGQYIMADNFNKYVFENIL